MTEPALGYGAIGGLAFVDKPQGEAQAGFGRPNVTAIGGLATEIHWVETTLTGLTSTPIILRNNYAQSYLPGHHSF